MDILMDNCDFLEEALYQATFRLIIMDQFQVSFRQIIMLLHQLVVDIISNLAYKLKGHDY